MRSLLSLVCAAGLIVCFFLTFSFRVTAGRSFSKTEVGLVGPWWTRVERAGRVSHDIDPLAKSALCGYAIPVFALASSRLFRRRTR